MRKPLKKFLNEVIYWLRKRNKMRRIVRCFEMKTISLLNSLIFIILVLICVRFLIENQLKSNYNELLLKNNFPKLTVTSITSLKRLKKIIAKTVVEKVPKETCFRNFSSNKGHNNSLDTNFYSLDEVNTRLKKSSVHLSFGGISKTKLNMFKCDTAINVAIIIPYRDRVTNLHIFLNNMHRILTKQKVNYGIFLVEPVLNATFNRGILMNIGFKEVNSVENQLYLKWNCFIFHDVDMIPEDERLIYTCNHTIPKHFATAVSKWGYRTTGYFSRYFGGINAFTSAQYEKINGFSNLYFDWGGEDDDLLKRSLKQYRSVERVDKTIARFIMVSHKTAKRNDDRWSIYNNKNRTLSQEGLSNLKYELKRTEKNLLFTHFFVDYEKSYFLEIR